MNELNKYSLLKRLEEQMVRDQWPAHEIKSILSDISDFLDYKIKKLESGAPAIKIKAGDL